MINQDTMDSEEPMDHSEQILLERNEKISTPTLHKLSSVRKTQHQDTTTEK